MGVPDDGRGGQHAAGQRLARERRLDAEEVRVFVDEAQALALLVR